MEHLSLTILRGAPEPDSTREPQLPMSTAETTLALPDRFEERLIAALTQRGLADATALQRAERARRKAGERLDKVLTSLGIVPERAMAEVLAACLSLPLMQPADVPESALFEEQLPVHYVRGNHVLPLAADDARVVLAMADPRDEDVASAIAFLLDRRVERCVAAPADIEAAIERLYGAGKRQIDEGLPGELAEDVSDEDIDRLKDIASEAPIIRLVQQIIARAVEAEASDIHIEPAEDSVRVRYRIDGILHTVETLPPGVRAAVTSRVKIMARLNIAERRLPQDGRIKLAVRGKDIDLRVSTMPTLYGESVVLRILDRASVRLVFEDLGFEEPMLSSFKAVLQQPNGIVLVTGPTGSGKTTTLYAALAMLNSPELKVFTVEDPIEYHLGGVNQIQVQPKIGLSFSSALRSILRQDPDIVMIGEIRDLETAEIAIQASLTGHLVLSTIHTNSAASTVVRLLDMGIEDYLLASSLTAVLAQRLVRRLCPKCAAPKEMPARMLQKLAAEALPGSTAQAIEQMVSSRQLGLSRAVGCQSCRNTGYSGRTAVLELLELTDAVREQVAEGATERTIEDSAIAAGMVSMYRHGLTKALRGETTLEEVMQVTRIR